MLEIHSLALILQLTQNEFRVIDSVFPLAPLHLEISPPKCPNFRDYSSTFVSPFQSPHPKANWKIRVQVLSSA